MSGRNRLVISKDPSVRQHKTDGVSKRVGDVPGYGSVNRTANTWRTTRVIGDIPITLNYCRSRTDRDIRKRGFWEVRRIGSVPDFVSGRAPRTSPVAVTWEALVGDGTRSLVGPGWKVRSTGRERSVRYRPTRVLG